MLQTKTLKPFQLKDAEIMAVAGNCINGSEPGTGKTAVGIGLVEKLNTARNLIIVPKSVLYQYQNEFLAFNPGVTTTVVTGGPIERKARYKAILEQPAYTVLLTYETLRIDIKIIAEFPAFQSILFDEVHRLASHATKTHKAVRNLLAYYKKNNYPAPRIFGFTASAIMNSPMDLYGIFNILQPKLFPNWYWFVSEYMYRTPQGWLAGPRKEKLNKLGELIRPYFIKRTLAEVAPELPPHLDQTVLYDLSADEQKLYNKIRKELLFEFFPAEISNVKNILSIRNALTKMQKLQELTDSADLIGTAGIKSTKMEILKEKLKELLTDNNRKCVIFSRFARMANLVMAEVAEYNPVKIIGEVGAEEREDNIFKFKNNQTCRIMVMTTAGSEGISLEEASYLIRLDTPFSIGRDIQLSGRIRRITTLEPTFSFTLAARNTVDEKVLKILEKKKLMNSAIFDEQDVKGLLE